MRGRRTRDQRSGSGRYGAHCVSEGRAFQAQTTESGKMSEKIKSGTDGLKFHAEPWKDSENVFLV